MPTYIHTYPYMPTYIHTYIHTYSYTRVQAPERFTTAIMCNPVTNLATMVATSDIPDWVYVEAIGSPGVVAYSDNPTLAEQQAFYRASPIAHVSKVGWVGQVAGRVGGGGVWRGSEGGGWV